MQGPPATPPHQTGRADFPHPAFLQTFSCGSMFCVHCHWFTCFPQSAFGQTDELSFDGCTFTASPLRSRMVNPFLATLRPSDSRPDNTIVGCGSLRFLDFSFAARCLQPPRGVRRVHINVTSPSVSDFSQLGRLVTPTFKRNEAESSLLALRLAASPFWASTWGLLLSPPAWLHDGHLVVMVITFHITREVRLGLTHLI